MIENGNGLDISRLVCEGCSSFGTCKASYSCERMSRAIKILKDNIKKQMNKEWVKKNRTPVSQMTEEQLGKYYARYYSDEATRKRREAYKKRMLEKYKRN